MKTTAFRSELQPPNRPPVLNGVQEVAGSNPAGPTNLPPIGSLNTASYHSAGYAPLRYDALGYARVCFHRASTEARLMQKEISGCPVGQGRAAIMPRLTKGLVEGMRSTCREQWIWDALPGFGVRMTPAGVVTYYVQYRNSVGQTRRLALGRHGRLTVDQARKIAGEKLAAVAAGRGPRRGEASGPTGCREAGHG